MSVASFHRLALRELEEVHAHYEGESPGLGGRFASEVEHSISLILQFPQIGQRVEGPIRRILVSGFPYDLLYRFTGRNHLRILSVAHHRRGPGYWVGRR